MQTEQCNNLYTQNIHVFDTNSEIQNFTFM